MPEAGAGRTQGEPAHKPRNRFVIADAIDDTIEMAKHIGKRSGDAAEEFMDDTMQRIKRHPIETMIMVFGAGFIAGGFLCWLSRQR